MKYCFPKTIILILLLLLILDHVPLERSLSHPNIEWQRTYGEEGSEFAYSIIQTEDNGFALIGCTIAGAGGNDILLVKTDENGEVKWDQIFGGYYNEEGYSVIQTVDKGFAILGYTGTYGSGVTDMWLIKTDEEGILEWEKTYGGSQSEMGYTVVQTKNGGFLLSGYSNTYGINVNQIWLVKTNETGEIQWDQMIGSPNGMYDSKYVFHKGPLLQTPDQGFVIAGITQETHGTSAFNDVLFVKGKKSGRIDFHKTYGTWEDDSATSMIQTKDGGFAVAGYINHVGDNKEAFLLKIDNNGTEQWFKTYGRSVMDKIYSVIQTNDGGFALAGITSTSSSKSDPGTEDMWLLRTDKEGEPLWNQSFGGDKSDGAYSLIQTSDDCFVLAGYTASYGIWDFWLVKTADAPPKSRNTQVLILLGLLVMMLGGIILYLVTNRMIKRK
ncbi:MAG: hypothetical protein ACFFDC_00630 [Promethearchaeota archaeon]